MSVEIQVKPEVLRWAINASDKSKVDLEKDIKDIDAVVSATGGATFKSLSDMSLEENKYTVGLFDVRLSSTRRS